MVRKKSIWLLVLLSVLYLSAYTALADTTGEAVPKENGQSEIWAGVVVDYMGELRFVVLNKKNNEPIPNVSVELYIPSLDRYVLFGVTDANGVYELDIVYNMPPGMQEEDQFDTVDGSISFLGNILYLNSNQLQYQVYKSGWLLYPHQGIEILESKEIPQTVIIHLYKKEEGGGGDVDPPVEPTEVKPVKPPEGNWFEDGVPDFFGIGDGTVPRGRWNNSGAIPKTGLEGTAGYWITGIFLLLIAETMIIFLMKKDGRRDETERRE